MNPQLTAIGNPVFDIIETPYVKTLGRVLSGCSTNACLAFSKLGGRSALVGRVSKDFYNKLLSKAGEYGIHAYPLYSDESGGFHLVYHDSRMTDRTLKVLGIAGSISYSEFPRELLRSELFIIAPILGEVDYQFVRNLRGDIGQEKLILVDPQGLIREIEQGVVVRKPREDAYKVLSISDVFKPNEHECEVLFPGLHPSKAAVKIVNRGSKVGIVTVADRGSYVAWENKLYHVPAYKTVERDPTGCGDVYIGAYAYKYLQTRDPLVSSAYASAAASFMVESVGPDFPLPRKIVEERFQWIYDRVKRVEA